MFGFLRKKSAALRFKQVKLFGKLPGFADFVRFRSADPDAVLWDDWFTQGISSLVNAQDSSCLTEYWSLNTCREINGVYHLTSLLSSHDRSGRKFPIVVLAEVHNHWLDDYKPSFPLLFEELDDFGRSFQLNHIDTHVSLTSAIEYIQKDSLPLNKGELLEARIKSLKKLTQDQAWGRWADEFPDLERSSWKKHVIESLNHGKEWEFPLGSDQVADESAYWLQLIDDLRNLKNHQLSYYCLYSETVKKLIVRLNNPELPDFRNLFIPSAPGLIIQSPDPRHQYQPDMDLLAGINYWKQVVS